MPKRTLFCIMGIEKATSVENGISSCACIYTLNKTRRLEQYTLAPGDLKRYV